MARERIGKSEAAVPVAFVMPLPPSVNKFVAREVDRLMNTASARDEPIMAANFATERLRYVGCKKDRSSNCNRGRTRYKRPHASL